MADQSFAVIGLGQFGRHLALTLSRQGMDVVVIDRDPHKIEDIKDLVARAVRMDCTNEDSLRAARVNDVSCAVLALGEEDFEDSVLAVTALVSLGVKRVVARSSSPTRGRILQIVGASSVVFPEIHAADQLALALASPGLQAATALPSGFTLAQVVAPAILAGLTLREADLRQKYKVMVIAVRRAAERAGRKVDTTLEAEPDLKLQQGDVMVVVGQTERVDALGREMR